MYLVETKNLTTEDLKCAFINDPAQTMFLPTPFLNQVANAEKYECWGTSFKDAGKDYTDHILIAKGHTIAEHRVFGY